MVPLLFKYLIKLIFSIVERLDSTITWYALSPFELSTFIDCGYEDKKVSNLVTSPDEIILKNWSIEKLLVELSFG